MCPSRSARSLFALAVLLGCASSPPPAPRATAAPDAGPPLPDAAMAPADAVAVSPADAVAAAPPAVMPRALLHAADATPGWVLAGAMRPVGTRAALSARLWAIAQRRLAAMSPEARREAWVMHRELSAQSPSVDMGGSGSATSLGSVGLTPMAAAPVPASGAAGPSSITNNQVAALDEGDIVKASGEDLIILRRGHLFRVSLANQGTRLVAHAPAYPPNTRPGDWYDELLVDGDIALVLGYSYLDDATEVNRFRLQRDGAIRYVDSFYLRSDDYYSSENYALRLVNGRLVAYMPSDLGHDDPWDRRLRLPAVRVGRAGAYRATLDGAGVFVTDLDRAATVLHTVLQCDVRGPRVSCGARGVLGGDSRTFYVSPTAVYVWTMTDDEPTPASWIVRLPLDRAEAPGALRVQGGPTNQFSFDERDGALHALLRAEGRGEAMDDARGSAAGEVSALRVPLAALIGQVRDAPAGAYTRLTALPRGGVFRNRWVGDHCLFGTGRDLDATKSAEGGSLFAYRASSQRLFEVRPGHGVERLEALGPHALAVGNAGAVLALTPIALDGPLPALAPTLRLPQRAQGETRSHAFFFRPSGERDGVFGVATAGRSRPVAHELVGPSDVSFFRVSQLTLSPLGTIPARRVANARCAVSCLDWYGNTRPIFWGERVFALLGDELVEVTVGAGDLAERSRVDFGEGVQSVTPRAD